MPVDGGYIDWNRWDRYSNPTRYDMNFANWRQSNRDTEREWERSVESHNEVILAYTKQLEKEKTKMPSLESYLAFSHPKMKPLGSLQVPLWGMNKRVSTTLSGFNDFISRNVPRQDYPKYKSITRDYIFHIETDTALHAIYTKDAKPMSAYLKELETALIETIEAEFNKAINEGGPKVNKKELSEQSKSTVNSIKRYIPMIGNKLSANCPTMLISEAIVKTQEILDADKYKWNPKGVRVSGMRTMGNKRSITELANKYPHLGMSNKTDFIILLEKLQYTKKMIGNFPIYVKP